MVRAAPLLLLALLLGRAARADEPPPLAPRLAGEVMPAPGAVFAADLAFRVDGRVVGEARLEAEVAPLPGAPAGAPPRWHVRERLRVERGDEAGQTTLDAWLDRGMDPVRGRQVEGLGPEARVYAFAREGEAFAVEVSGDGRTPLERRAAREGPSLVGLTSLVLLARRIGGEEGTYGARLFAPDWEYLLGEKPFVSVRLRTGPEVLDGRPVRRLRLDAPDDDRAVEVVLDAETLALLRLRTRPPGAHVLELVPREEGDPGDGDGTDSVDLDAPPATARAAAMVTTLAFLTADAKRFEGVVHWPRLREAVAVKGAVSAEAFKEAILEQFRKNAPPPAGVDAARRRILEAADAFRVEPEGEARAVVRLPPQIAPMRVTVERHEGRWYLVRLPES